MVGLTPAWPVAAVPRTRPDLPRSLRDHLRRDLPLPDQERLLVEALATHPPGDLAVALAGVAAATGRDHVVDGVAAPREMGSTQSFCRGTSTAPQ